MNDSNKQEAFEDWEWKKIILKSDSVNNDYYDTTKKFLIDLSEEYKKFKDNKNEIYKFEKINSPLTFIDGYWGSGKTFFIKKLDENFNKLKNEKEIIFKKKIYIDTLDLLDDENIIYSFLYELIRNNEKLKNIAFKNIKKGANVIIAAFNGVRGSNLEKLSIKNESDKIIEALKNEKDIIKEKTIVFIDNIERIGTDSNKIIKLIYKLRKTNNLVFVLITNIKKLPYYIEDDKNHNLNEYPIYKFINLSPFKLEQDYSSLIRNIEKENKTVKTKKITNKDLNVINDILNKSKNGEIFSIRRFEKWIRENNFLESNDPIKLFLKLKNIKYIDLEDIFKKRFSKEINNYLELLKKADDNFNYLKNEILKADLKEKQKIDSEGYVREGTNYLTKDNRTIRKYSMYPDIWRIIENNRWTREQYKLEEVKKIAKKKEDVLIYKNKNLSLIINDIFNKDSDFKINDVFNYEKNINKNLDIYKNFYKKTKTEIDNFNLLKKEKEKTLIREKQLLKSLKEIDKLKIEKEKLLIELNNTDRFNAKKRGEIKYAINDIEEQLKEIKINININNETNKQIKEKEKNIKNITSEIKNIDDENIEKKKLIEKWEIKNIEKWGNNLINSIKKIEKDIHEDLIIKSDINNFNWNELKVDKNKFSTFLFKNVFNK